MFVKEDVETVAKILKIQFTDFTKEDLLIGMNEELEHGLNYANTNITNDNPILTAKLALAHLNVYPNYYNKEYGLPYFEKMLRLKLDEKQKTSYPASDDVKEKEC